MSSKLSRIAENAAKIRLGQIQEMYCCPLGSVLCSLSKLTNKDIDYTLNTFKKLKEDEVFKTSVHNFREMIDYIIVRYYDDFVDYNCLYLLVDTTNRCSPTVLPLIDGTLNSFRFDDFPSKILSDALMCNDDEHISIERIYDDE